MEFGICVMADVDEIGFFNHAEGLGYDSVWVTSMRNERAPAEDTADV